MSKYHQKLECLFNIFDPLSPPLLTPKALTLEIFLWISYVSEWMDQDVELPIWPKYKGGANYGAGR